MTIPFDELCEKYSVELSTDDYRQLKISDVTQMRLDVKKLLSHCAFLQTKLADMRAERDSFERSYIACEKDRNEIAGRYHQAMAARDAAVEDLSGHCEYCVFRNDCAKHDNNDSDAGLTWWTDCDDWQWRGYLEGKNVD